MRLDTMQSTTFWCVKEGGTIWLETGELVRARVTRVRGEGRGTELECQEEQVGEKKKKEKAKTKTRTVLSPFSLLTSIKES